ncbi:MAG: glycosyltransferase family 2 protein, partial [Anaerolineales bacterium]
VAQQSYPNIEIIVIDDHSSDGTGEIVRGFHTSRPILYVRNKANLGAAKSRNIGIETARGTLIGLLDADDLWHPEFLEIQVQNLQRLPEFDAICAQIVLVDSFGIGIDPASQDSRSSASEIEEHTLPRVWQKLDIALSSVVARRSAMLDVGLFTDGYTEDVNFWLKFCTRHRIAETQAVLVSYRKHDSQKTADGNRILVGRTKAYLAAAEEFPEIRDQVGSSSFRNRMYQLCKGTGDYYFYSLNAWRDASFYYRHAVRFRPHDLDALMKLAWCILPERVQDRLKSLRKSIRGSN